MTLLALALLALLGCTIVYTAPDHSFTGTVGAVLAVAAPMALVIVAMYSSPGGITL